MAEDDPQTCFVLFHAASKETMDKFFSASVEIVAKSGHILESTEVDNIKELANHRTDHSGQLSILRHRRFLS